MSIKGLDTFLDVFEIIKNPAKYEAKIEELKKVTAQYKETVEAVVALAGVNDFILSIRDREEATKKELEQAQKTAADIKAEANEFLKKKQEEAKVHDVELVKKEQVLVSLQKDLDDRSVAFAKKEAELSQATKVLAEKEKALQDAQAVLKEKQDKLAAALR